MADKSKIRMNLAAIKKVDPYAKDIVDSSSHVAFYTFNSEQNEWEKTDVEGAFFIYSRNAQPFHSIFINNRLNTTSFVEPITSQLELQSQPPFLLYRNERSRIRGFWFYNSQECDRIGNLVNILVQKVSVHTILPESIETAESKTHDGVNIFKMLSKAQQEYNNSQSSNSAQQNLAECNVLKFFASAKPTTADLPFFQRILPNTLSVDQLEKQQRVKTPLEESQICHQKHLPPMPNVQANCVTPENNILSSCTAPSFIKLSPVMDSAIPQLPKFHNTAAMGSVNTSLSTTEKDNYLRNILVGEPSSFVNESIKPALMPPTMFDKRTDTSNSTFVGQEPLNQSQLVQAFSYLIQNDEDFVHKLHQAYLKMFPKTILETFQ